MKKIFLPIVVCLATAMSANAVDAGNANIYASGLKVSESGNSVQFIANAPGTATIKFYKAGEQVLKIEGKEVIKGVNVVDLAYIFPETVKAGDELTWDVTLKADANESIKGFSTYASKVAELSNGGSVTAEIWTNAGTEVADAQKMEFPYSIAVDNNPTSPNFGNIYVLNDAGQSYGSIERESGLYVYDSNLNLLNTTPYTEGLSMRGAYFGENSKVYVPVSPYAVTVDEEGYVFISDNSGYNKEGGIYVASPKDVSKFTKLIPTVSGIYYQDLAVTGKGENKTLWVLNETGSKLLKYVIGDMTAENYTAEEVCTLTSGSTFVAGGNASNSFDTYPARMCSDKQGGFWVLTGNQSTLATGNYWLNHVNAEGVMDYGGGKGKNDEVDGYLATSDSNFNLYKKIYDIDTNSDGSVMTIAIAGTIVSFDVTYGNNVTTTTIVQRGNYIKGADETTSPYGIEGNSLHPVTTGVAYDTTDNLYVTDLSGYFQAFALPKADNSYTTAANDKLVVTGGLLTGVESTIADENAPVEYFNMQGVKVNAPENGIFIKKQAGKTSKVIL